MKKLLLISLAFLVAGVASAAEGYNVKAASGSTSAAVFFPGGKSPLRITSYDVTSDLSSSTLKFHAGTAGYSVLKSAASAATTCWVSKNTLASNDVVLLQNAADTVVLCQVSTNTTVTNKSVMLQKSIGTNLAVGDAIKTKLTAPFTLISVCATNTTAYLVDNLTGLAANDTLVFDRGSGAALLKDTVSAVATNARKFITLKTPVQKAVTIGDAVYEVVTATNTYCSLGTNATATELQTTNTTGFADGDKVLLVAESGDRAIATITTVTSNTKFLLGDITGIPVALYDKIYLLHGTSYTATLPATAGDNSLVLSASTTLASNDTVVVASTGFQPWRAVLSATPATTNIYTLTMNTGFVAAGGPPQAIYKLTNTYATVLTALATDNSLVLDTATNLTTAMPVVIIPASGGVFANTLATSGADYPITQLGFTNTLGLTLAVGDSVWLMGSTNSTVIGAATARRDGSSIFTADTGRPVRAVITGTSACSINSMTGLYP